MWTGQYHTQVHEYRASAEENTKCKVKQSCRILVLVSPSKHDCMICTVEYEHEPRMRCAFHPRLLADMLRCDVGYRTM